MRLGLALPLSILATLLASASARPDDTPLTLKQDPNLGGSAVAGSEGPLFLFADRVESNRPGLIEATGNVEARKAGQNVFADFLRYDQNLQTVDAHGGVRFEQTGLVLTGDSLKLHLDSNTGSLTQAQYHVQGSQTAYASGSTETTHPSAFHNLTGRGRADSIDMQSHDVFTAEHATFTTCPIGDDDWQLSAGHLEIDQDKQIGTGRNVLITFMGTPMLYTPWASFPLNDARKTGFLSPTLGFTGNNGLDLVIPYYFNLAPNYDATLYPRFLATRGLQLGGEFRYLGKGLRGEYNLEYLANDKTDGRSRWLTAIKQTQQYNPNLKFEINFERVSDDNYFRDFSNQVEFTSLSILPQEVVASYDGDWWKTGLRIQQEQVLQDPSLPILQTPFYHQPQWTLLADHDLGNYLRGSVVSEFSHFYNPKYDPTNQVQGGNRFTIYPSIKLPYSDRAFFVTPKVGYHYTHYDKIDKPLAGMATSQDYGIPIASLDSGVILDRSFNFRDSRYQQTLEPRLYYVYAPYRNQNSAPIFDTAPLDLSYDQIFSENQFVGGDRVNDANQLTLAMTTRFTDETEGLERLKLAIGQRYYLASQLVTMPGGTPRTSTSTDLLALASGQINKAWRVDAGWEFDTNLGKTIQNNFSTSYQSGTGRTANLGYRFQNGSVEQLDTALQWPLTHRLYGLLRANYSLRDHNLVEGLTGFEYNGGCWVLRAVVQRIATAQKDTSNSFYLQLELNGMGRLGASPLSALSKSIPGYTPTNDFDTQ